jgi:hypothetical protein
MTNLMLDRPLFVKHARYIQELASLDDVFDFLDEWPA